MAGHFRSPIQVLVGVFPDADDSDEKVLCMRLVWHVTMRPLVSYTSFLSAA